MFKPIIFLALLLPNLLAAQGTADKLPNCSNIVVWSFNCKSCETNSDLPERIISDMESILTKIKPGCKVLNRKDYATLNTIIKEERSIEEIKKSEKTKEELSKLKAETVMLGSIQRQGANWRVDIRINDLNSSELLISDGVDIPAQKMQSNHERREDYLRPLIQKMVGYTHSEPKIKNPPKIKEPGTFSSGEKWALAGIGAAGVGSVSYGIASMIQGKNLYQTYEDVRFEGAPEYATESRDDLYERANKKYVLGQVCIIGGTAILAGGAWWLTKRLKEKPKKGIGTSSLWYPNLSLEPLVSSDATQMRVGIALTF